MQGGPTSLNEALPAEILTSIASYLEPAELANLRLVSRTFAALSDETFDIVWQPHLVKLKQIDTSISLLPPEVPIAGWRQAQFKQHFIRIAQEQMEETNHFKECSENAQAAFVQITRPAKTLSQVLQREQLLNEFNARMIKSKIDTNRFRLDISNMGLTRFPKQLFKDENLTSYWPALTTLNLGNNLIKCLPNTLGTSCTALQLVNFASNRLTTLPDTLGNCTALQMLYCHNNQLTALPNALGSCTALQILFCQNNKLAVLPPSLANCAILYVLGLDGNFLKTIPSEIRTRLGEVWYQFTMGSQKALQKSSLLADFLKECSKGMTKTRNYLKPLAKKVLNKID